MPAPSAPIDLDGLVPLSTQVAGHASGVFSLPSGLMIKPCLPVELAFYSSLPSSHPLRPFLPSFHGIVDMPTSHNGKHSQGIVLQNLTHGFNRPNVLDIKLGTQLWDDDANEDKRQRMEKQAAETTSKEYGIRMTGWQVHIPGVSATILRCPKPFGKSLKTYDDLLISFRLFFGVPPGAASKERALLEDILSRYAAEGDKDGELRPESELLQVRRGVMMRVLEERVRPELARLTEEVKSTEWRIRGGSILIVYEGELDKLEDLVDSDSEETPALRMKLIDFAHAKLTPGQGPDEGVLKGLETVRRMLEDCIQLLAGSDGDA